MTVEIPNKVEDLPTSKTRFIGKAVDRVEDPQLLTGRAAFIDNLTMPGMARMIEISSTMMWLIPVRPVNSPA